MKKTWKDTLTAKMQQQIRNHKWMKKPITILMILITLFFNIGAYLAYNTKRFASVFVILIFFVVSSSFSFLPVSENMEMAYESEWTEIQESYEYVPTMFHMSEEDVLDDNDVMVGYDNDELDVSAEEMISWRRTR